MRSTDAMTVIEHYHLISARPSSGYRLIVADPPWDFGNWSVKGEAKSPKAQYSCMPTEDICALPIEAIASRNSVLLLWATFPMLPDAFRVMASWGFTYRTGGAWIKTTVNGKAAFGTGYIFRSATEAFLLGVRGQPRALNRSTRNLIGFETLESYLEGLAVVAERREHSRKPGSFYEMCTALFPGPRIELFSKTDRVGWDTWGDEAGTWVA